MSSLTLLTLPIGNLGDLTERGKTALESGNHFICEDTRTLKSLMQHLGIDYSQKFFYAFHDHSTEGEVKNLIKIISENSEVYLVSDAGNPLISDPGFPLVKKSLVSGIEIKTVPGVSSILVALELSGLPPFPFYFYGFYSQESSKQNELLNKIKSLKGTHLFFEGASRVEKTISECAQLFPEKSLVVARELTKKFETIYRFKGKEWESVKANFLVKGEFVILIHNEVEKVQTQNELIQLAEEILAEGARPKKLAKLLGQILDRPTKDIYQEILKFES